jgi:hypothetical protein
MASNNIIARRRTEGAVEGVRDICSGRRRVGCYWRRTRGAGHRSCRHLNSRGRLR